MERARHQLLAGAALARDEDGRAGRRGHLDEVMDLLHRAAGAEETAEPARFFELATEEGHLAHDLRLLERLLDERPEPARLHRLGDVVVDPALHRRHRGIHGRVPGEDDHCGGRAVLLKGAGEGQAVHPGHHEVRDHQIRPDRERALEGLVAVVRLLDLVSPAGQQCGETIERVGVVIGHKNSLCHGRVKSAIGMQACRHEKSRTCATPPRRGG